jgi:hypothetical protein
MPRLSDFYGIIIYLYYYDHNPPHFHARYGEYECVISMVDLTLLYGSIPPRAYSLVIEWAALHRAELVDNWERVKSGEEPVAISPLP